MQTLQVVFQSILDMGAAVFLPIIIFIIGLIVGLKPGKAIGLLESNPKYCLIQSVSPELKKIKGGEYGPVPGEQELIVLATRNQTLP